MSLIIFLFISYLSLFELLKLRFKFLDATEHELRRSPESLSLVEFLCWNCHTTIPARDQHDECNMAKKFVVWLWLKLPVIITETTKSRKVI